MKSSGVLFLSCLNYTSLRGVKKKLTVMNRFIVTSYRLIPVSYTFCEKLSTAYADFFVKNP